VSSDIAPRLAKNSAYYALKSFVALAAMLLVTPFILKSIGKDHYGIWALAGVMTSYAQLSDFGITESLVKYAAEYHAHRDSDRLNRLVNTALVFLCGLAVIVGCISALLLPFITREVLKIPALLQAEALLIFRLAVVVFLINMLFGVFVSLVVSSQKIGYTCFINITTTIIGFVGTLIFLHLGYGLRGLIAINTIVAFVNGFFNMAVAWKLFPVLRINFIRWTDYLTIKQIFSFSWKIQTSNMSQLLIFQIDRILLSRYLGLEAVAYYEIGSNAAYYAKSFLSVMFAPMVPATSALHANNEHGLISGLYNRSFKFMALLAIPFCFLVIAIADPFILLWMGPGFSLSAITLQLLMPAYLINIMTGPGTFILNGINRPDVAMRSAIFAGIANLILCYVLIKILGYFGLILGISLALTSSAVYFAVLLHRTIPGIDWGIYRRALFLPILFSFPVAMLLLYCGTQFNLASIPALVVAALVYSVLVGLMIAKSSHLDEFERTVLVGLFPFKRREN